MNTYDTTAQQDYLDQFKTKAESDSRILALWVEGSFGRGNADRYSDLDFHILVNQADFLLFRNGLDFWLAEIRPVPFCVLRFDKMVNALTDNGIRIDIWLHTEPQVAIDPNTAKVLFDRGDFLRTEDRRQPPNAVPVAAVLAAEIAQFWRGIALGPSVVGRSELIVGFQGLSVEVGILTNVLLLGYGIERDRGVKNLNQFLPESCRAEIESAISMKGLTRESLMDANLALARLMARYGREFAATHRFDYPIELETAVMGYVHQELQLLGFSL